MFAMLSGKSRHYQFILFWNYKQRTGFGATNCCSRPFTGCIVKTALGSLTYREVGNADNAWSIYPHAPPIPVLPMPQALGDLA
jgi:hypothetical protein